MAIAAAAAALRETVASLSAVVQQHPLASSPRLGYLSDCLGVLDFCLGADLLHFFVFLRFNAKCPPRRARHGRSSRLAPRTSQGACERPPVRPTLWRTTVCYPSSPVHLYASHAKKHTRAIPNQDNDKRQALRIFCHLAADPPPFALGLIAPAPAQPSLVAPMEYSPLISPLPLHRQLLAAVDLHVDTLSVH